MMNMFATFTDPLHQIAETGGPVVVILMAVAVLTLALTLYKLWQFRMSAVGQHAALAEAEARFARLESGLRPLDSVAQLAPLLGLFGTVLGMIDAFQSLQSAGAQVDPSILAGGIWVALLTTAMGLVVAMPTALVLSWLEGRMEAERVIADQAILTVLHPAGSVRAMDAAGTVAIRQPVHG